MVNIVHRNNYVDFANEPLWLPTQKVVKTITGGIFLCRKHVPDPKLFGHYRRKCVSGGTQYKWSEFVSLYFVETYICRGVTK